MLKRMTEKLWVNPEDVDSVSLSKDCGEVHIYLRDGAMYTFQPVAGSLEEAAEQILAFLEGKPYRANLVHPNLWQGRSQPEVVEPKEKCIEVKVGKLGEKPEVTEAFKIPCDRLGKAKDNGWDVYRMEALMFAPAQRKDIFLDGQAVLQDDSTYKRVIVNPKAEVTMKDCVDAIFVDVYSAHDSKQAAMLTLEERALVNVLDVGCYSSVFLNSYACHRFITVDTCGKCYLADGYIRDVVVKPGGSLVLFRNTRAYNITLEEILLLKC